jgi:deoxyadenosine/deoxycytidine kinase
MIYLKASVPTLVRHIQQRGRNYENSMSINYLQLLNERYDEWINTYNEGKLLIINSDDLDFVNNPDDWNLMLNKINNAL